VRGRSVAVYEAKIVFGLAALVPALLLPLYAAFVWLVDRGRSDPTPIEQIARDFELLLPLAAALGVAHLMAVEHEEGFAELRTSYPEHPLRLPLIRTTGALLLACGVLAFGTVCILLVHGAHDPRLVLLPALGPLLALLGAALLIGNLFRSYWTAAGAVLAWWLFEELSRGTYTRAFFLFDYRWPQPEIGYTANRWLLVGLGLLFLAGNAYCSARRKRVGRVHG
jgi:hypothetical protein